MNNIILIMDESEAYLRSEVYNQAEKWGFKQSDIRSMETWNPTLGNMGVSLFGTVTITHLDLTDKKNLKSFVELIDKNKKTKMFDSPNWFGSGLIITSTTAVGTKKIEKLVESAGGQVIKKEKPEVMRKRLLDKLKLNKNVRNEVELYVGEDYEMLISVVNHISKFPVDEQASLTFDDIVVSLPAKPGAIPPWEFMDFIMKGDLKNGLEAFHRGIAGSHVLVAMTFAKRKLNMVYRLRVLLDNGVRDQKAQAKALGLKNSYEIFYTIKVAQKLSTETAEYIAKITLDVENGIKGSLNVDPVLQFETYLASVCIAIKYNKPLGTGRELKY